MNPNPPLTAKSWQLVAKLGSFFNFAAYCTGAEQFHFSPSPCSLGGEERSSQRTGMGVNYSQTEKVDSTLALVVSATSREALLELRSSQGDALALRPRPRLSHFAFRTLHSALRGRHGLFCRCEKKCSRFDVKWNTQGNQ